MDTFHAALIAGQDRCLRSWNCVRKRRWSADDRGQNSWPQVSGTQLRNRRVWRGSVPDNRGQNSLRGVAGDSWPVAGEEELAIGRRRACDRAGGEPGTAWAEAHARNVVAERSSARVMIPRRPLTQLKNAVFAEVVSARACADTTPGALTQPLSYGGAGVSSSEWRVIGGEHNSSRYRSSEIASA